MRAPVAMVMTATALMVPSLCESDISLNDLREMIGLVPLQGFRRQEVNLGYMR